MKVTSKEEAIYIIETQNSGLPFGAIKYLRNYGKDDEILKKVIEGLRNFGDHSDASLSYAIVAEGHIDRALIDPVIALYTSEFDSSDFMNEQGLYLFGKLLREIGEEVVEKSLAEIFRLHEIGSSACYHFLFDSFRFADLDKYDAQISKMLEKKDSGWASALYGDLAHPKFERYLPKFKELLSYYEKNKDKNVRYTSSIIEIKEAIKSIELGDKFVEWEHRFYSEDREDWEEHYNEFKGEYENDINSMKAVRDKIRMEELCFCGSRKQYQYCCKKENESVFAELWWKIENEDIIEFADEAIQAFNREISQDEMEEEDLGAFVYVFSDHLEFVRRYDKVEELYKVLKKQHPGLYRSDGECVENALFGYYCFKGERKKALDLWSGNVEVQYDEEDVLNKLAYQACNGFIDQVEELIESQYKFVVENPDLNSLAAQLRVYKFSIVLEKLYSSRDNKKSIEINRDIIPVLEKYDFEIDTKIEDYIEFGLRDSSVEKVKDLLSKYTTGESRHPILANLQLRFFVKMHEVGCSFLVSSYFTNRMFAYLLESNNDCKNWSDFFKFDLDFENFIISLLGFDSGEEIAGPLLIYGVIYFLEFLLEYNIINENQ